MIKCTTKILLKRPIADVFEFITQCENHPIWNSTFLEVWRISKNSSGIGTLFLLKREIPQGDVENTLEITELKQHEELTIETITGPSPFIYSYRFSPKGASTKLSLHAEVEAEELPPRTRSSKTYQSIKSRLEKNLRVLKTLLETGV